MAKNRIRGKPKKRTNRARDSNITKKIENDIVSKPQDAHLSSQRDNRFTRFYVFGQSYANYYTPGQLFWGFIFSKTL